jgi:cyclopropane-fatty-acyl-phospholipid synthase
LALAKSAPLRSALAQALPDRPFTVAFWDGTEVPATAPGPRFTVRSPRAVAHDWLVQHGLPAPSVGE